MKFAEILKLKTQRERVLLRLFLRAQQWHQAGSPDDARRLFDLWRKLRWREDAYLSPAELVEMLDAAAREAPDQPRRSAAGIKPEGTS